MSYHKRNEVIGEHGDYLLDNNNPKNVIPEPEYFACDLCGNKYSENSLVFFWEDDLIGEPIRLAACEQCIEKDNEILKKRQG